MATTSEKVRDWWDGLQPRERNMVAALAATAIICILGFFGFMITDGLSSLETKNDKIREALTQIHRHRLAVAKGGPQSTDVKIPEQAQAVDLENYTSKIANEVGVEFPKFNRGETTRGEFVEATGRIELKDLTVFDLKNFLEKVEGNPVVVVRELRIKQDFRDKEKLDVPEVVIGTFYRAGAGGEGDDEAAKEKDKEE